MSMSEATRDAIDLAESAIDGRQVVSFNYRDEKGLMSSRAVHPLGLWFWGKHWTLVSWCELRDDFRMFRIDRTDNFVLAGRTFKETQERSLAQCLIQFKEQSEDRSEER